LAKTTSGCFAPLGPGATGAPSARPSTSGVPTGRTSAECADLITEGRKWEVAETVAARITVRDDWHDVTPEQWLEREHALIERWVALRTDCIEVPPGKPHCESELRVDAEEKYVVGCDRTNVHDGPHRAEVTGDDDVTQRFEWPDAG